MRKNWHWIELIGFDNTSPDYGVAAFLSRLAKAPEGVSLLFSHIDFLNTFTPDGEYPLRPCDCSYSGHEFSVERRRQVWTNLQLKGLIRTLQAIPRDKRNPNDCARDPHELTHAPDALRYMLMGRLAPELPRDRGAEREYDDAEELLNFGY